MGKGGRGPAHPWISASVFPPRIILSDGDQGCAQHLGLPGNPEKGKVHGLFVPAANFRRQASASAYLPPSNQISCTASTSERIK